MASLMPGEHDWMKRIGGGLMRPVGGLLGAVGRGVGLLGSRLYGDDPEAQRMGLLALGSGLSQGGDFGSAALMGHEAVAGLMDRKLQSERMGLLMEQLRGQAEDRKAQRAEQDAIRSAMTQASLRRPGAPTPGLDPVSLPRTPGLPEQYARAAGELAGKGYAGPSMQFAEVAQKMMPKPNRPQYVGPGGVLLDPESGDVVFENPVKDRARGTDAPSGYRWSAGGNLEPIPGGPADPSVTNTRRGTQPLRKEFRGLQSVKDYETSLPLLVSARNAPDNGYGDLQLIYTAGKILDPNSVVREGELTLTIAAGSPLQRILGSTRFTAEQGGRLTPKIREQLLGMLNERVLAYRQAYDRDFNQYGQYAQESGIDPSLVVGSHAANAYPKPQKAESAKRVVRTGRDKSGRKVAQYSDGTIGYVD